MKPLVTLNKELSTGIHPGLAFDDVPLWEDGANAVFRRDHISPLISQFALAQKPSSSGIRGIFECLLNGEPTVFFGTMKKLYKWTKAAGVEDLTSVIGDYTGDDKTIWSFAQWGKWVLASNGKEGPQIYQPLIPNFEPFDTQNSTGHTFTAAQIIVPYKSFLVALNTTNVHGSPISGGEDFIHFSESDDIFKWDPLDVNNNECGDLPIRDAQGRITAAILYRRALYFFTAHAGHVLNFIGAPEFFGSQKMLDEGVVSKQGIDIYDNMLYGFGLHQLWRSDGTQIQSIDEPSIREYVFGLGGLNHEYRQLALTWSNPFDAIVEFHFPAGDSRENNRAVGFNPENGTWTIIERIRSAAARVNTLSYGLTGTANGDILAQQAGEYASSIRRSPSLGSPFIMSEESSRLYGFGNLGFGEGGFGGSSS